MQLTFQPVRLTGFAILAVATATALSVGGCSSSKNAQPPATSKPAAAKGKHKEASVQVRGQVASVSGNAVQVNQQSGTATVDVSPATKVTEYTRAQLTDVAAGNCVTVLAANPAPGGSVTANAVNLNPPGGDGKCLQPKTGHKVIGTVASVAGNTIHVTVTDTKGNPADTTVTVTDKTVYNKGVSANSQAIAQGKCITAHGTKNGGGTLQATAVALGPAENGQCPH